MAFEPIATRKGTPGKPFGRTNHKSKLVACIHRGHGAPDGKAYYPDRLYFRIHYDLWKQAGFEPGNRVSVLFDKDENKCVITPDHEGYTLSITSPSPLGFHLKFLFPFDASKGFPEYKTLTGMSDISVLDGCIHFTPTAPVQLKSFKKL